MYLQTPVPMQPKTGQLLPNAIAAPRSLRRAKAARRDARNFGSVESAAALSGSVQSLELVRPHRCLRSTTNSLFNQICGGPFSAVSKPIFHDLRVQHLHLHTFAPLESNQKNMKSASGTHQPGEKHSPGEETSRPQQCNKAWG